MNFSYTHDDIGFLARHRLPPVLRKEPAFVGSPADLPFDLDSVHVLKVGIVLSDDALPLHGKYSEITSAVAPYAHHVSAIATSSFHKSWVIICGTEAEFEHDGTLPRARDRRLFGVPGIVENNLVVSSLALRSGNFAYSPLESLAHAVAGAQLYKIECLIAGTARNRAEERDKTESFYKLASQLIAPLRRLVRASRSVDEDERMERGAVGLDDHLFRMLRSVGAAHLRELYLRQDTHELARRWRKEGRDALPRDWPSIMATPTIETALSQFEAARTMIARAHDLHIRSERKLRFSRTGEEAPVVAARQPDAENLIGPSWSTGDIPDIYGLTRLAVDFDVDPLAFWPQLEPWRVHFAAACWIGRLYRNRTGQMDVMPAEHWGLKGLIHAEADCQLPETTATARLFLRDYVPIDINALDTEPRPITREPLPRPAWNLRAKNK